MGTDGIGISVPVLCLKKSMVPVSVYILKSTDGIITGTFYSVLQNKNFIYKYYINFSSDFMH